MLLLKIEIIEVTKINIIKKNDNSYSITLIEDRINEDTKNILLCDYILIY